MRTNQVLPESKSDLQSRLCYINERLEKIEEETKDNPVLSELAHLTSYLLLIVYKHMQTGEV